MILAFEDEQEMTFIYSKESKDREKQAEVVAEGKAGCASKLIHHSRD